MCAAVAQKGVWGVAPSGVRAAAPHSAPARTPGVYAQRLYARTHTSGRTKSVQDAPTTNDHGCTDAKLLECPKWDRVREFVLFL